MDYNLGYRIAKLTHENKPVDECPSMSALSRFIEGESGDSERNYCIEHILHCDKCYRAVSETIKLEEEISASPELVNEVTCRPHSIDIVDTPLNRLGRGIRKILNRGTNWYIAGPAIAAVILLLAWTMKPARQQSFSDLMALANVTSKANQLNSANDIDIKTAVVWGFANGLSLERAAFRIGVLTSGIEISLQAGDTRKAWLQLQPLISLLHAIDNKGNLQQGFQQISMEIEKGIRLNSINEQVIQISSVFEEKGALFFLSFGQWVQTSRLACAIRNPDFPTLSDIEGYRLKAEKEKLPKGVIKSLNTIQGLKESGLSDNLYLSMENHFNSILTILF